MRHWGDNMSNVQNYDCEEYRQFTGPMEASKAFHMLFGILQGIQIDDKIDLYESDELNHWCKCHHHLAHRPPFDTIFPLISESLSDGILSNEEYQDIMWLACQYKESKYHDLIKVAIQELHGYIHGIIANNAIVEKEAFGLSEWLSLNDFLQGIFPFDEINAILTNMLADGKLDENESQLLKAYLSSYVDTTISYNLNQPELKKLREDLCVTGICAVCPDIVFADRTFCFTGKSQSASRFELADKIVSLGGIFRDSVSSRTNYLIVGSDGNPCWAYSCYGRKVEKAMNLRKEGAQVMIVHESDFWDAIVDFEAID
jgi:hypothetical protein